VYALESGVVVNMRCFTGKYANCPWWNETDALYIQGKTGVIVYGEIEIRSSLKLRDTIKRGEYLGKVKTVLRKDKGRPMSMLHIELYEHFRTREQAWELNGEKPHWLLDPTPYLLECIE